MSRTLSKYEETKIIGLRATQIAYGSEPCVDCKSLDPLTIARQELKEKKIPMILLRPYPDGTKKEVIINK
jgi:DNA-directed RNA polymerases I, II, and III subunit RPABC2